MANESYIQWCNIIIDKELPLTLEKYIKWREVSIGEEKDTSVHSFTDKNYEHMDLNNFKKELIFEIKQYLSSSESAKTS